MSSYNSNNSDEYRVQKLRKYHYAVMMSTLLISFLVFKYFIVEESGFDYNEVRKERGVPIIEKNWVKKGVLWESPHTETRLNYHEFKEVHKSSFELLRELDRFALEDGKSRLIMSYSYELENEGKYPWLIHYCKGYSSEGFGDCESHSEISLEEAKRILDSYEEISYSPKVSTKIKPSPRKLW